MRSRRSTSAPAGSCTMPFRPHWRKCARAGGPAAGARRSRASRAPRLSAPPGPRLAAAGCGAACGRPGWGPRRLAECERLASVGGRARQQRIAYRTLARVMSALVRDPGACVGHAGSHRLDGDRHGLQRFRQRLHRPRDRAAAAAGRAQRGLQPAAAAGAARRHQYQGPVGVGQEHPAAAAEETCGRHRRATGAISR